MKKIICIILVALFTLNLLAGCEKSDAEELAKLREENELLRQELANSGIMATESIQHEQNSNDNQASFEPLKFSGDGDKVFTNVNLPRGIFVATITVHDDALCIIKYHLDDDSYESVYSDVGSCYKQEYLIKGSIQKEVTNGILEIESSGGWTIEISSFQGTSAMHPSRTGAVVTGLFAGDGKKSTVYISMNTDCVNIVKLYEYDPNGDRLRYDAVVSEAGPYNGECLIDTEEGKQYFWVVESEGDWSISNQKPKDESSHNSNIVQIKISELLFFVDRYNEFTRNFNKDTGYSMKEITFEDAKSGKISRCSWSSFEITTDSDGKITDIIYMAELERVADSEYNLFSMLYDIAAIMEGLDVTEEQRKSFTGSCLDIDLGNGEVFSRTYNGYTFEFELLWGLYFRLLVTKN